MQNGLCALYHRQTSTAYHSSEPSSSWVCSGTKKRGTHTGPSKYTWESEMKGMLFTLFKGFHQFGADMAKRILHPLEQLQPRTSVASEREKTQAANGVAGRRGSA